MMRLIRPLLRLPETRLLRAGVLACLLTIPGRPEAAYAAEEPVQEIDELAVPDNLIQLDGSGSSDNDGDRLSYNWRQVDGPQIQLMNSTSAKPSFYARQPGRYSFELVVSDGKVRSKPAVVSIEVDKLNRAPKLQLVKTVQAAPGVSFILDASGTQDEDGDTLRYLWKQVSGPAALTNGGSSASPTLTLRAQQEGTYVFEVIATDGAARSAPQRCEVQVVRPNSAPVAKVNAPGQKVYIRSGQPAAETPAPLTTSDKARSIKAPSIDEVAVPAVDPLEEAMNQPAENALKDAYLPQARPTASGARVRNAQAADAAQTATAEADDRQPSRPSASGKPTPSAAAQKANPLRASATVEDQAEEAAPAANDRKAAGTAAAKSRADVLAASTSGDRQAEVGERVVVRGYGVSPQGKRLNFNWRQITTQKLGRDTLKGRDLEFTPTEDGLYIFELTVSDGMNHSEPAIVRVQVAGTNENVMGMAGEAGKVNEVDVPGIAPVPAAENRGLFSRVLNKIK